MYSGDPYGCTVLPFVRGVSGESYQLRHRDLGVSKVSRAAIRPTEPGSPTAAGDRRLGARWRLRDLRGRDRWFAITISVLVLVPFAVALVRGFRDGWVPSGDQANIAIRSLDVFSRHPPLTGLPSTSVLYGSNTFTNHPGPIEFYLLAVPVRVLGASIGSFLGSAAINGAFVFIALWVFLRRLGVAAMCWAGLLLLVVLWSAGSAVLTDPVSSNMTMYSLLCTAVIAWALIDGDLALLPLGAFVASYAAQQHLAAGFIVLVVIGAALVIVSVQAVLRVRRGDIAAKRSVLRWSGAAACVAAMCWAPVIYDQLTRRPGNLSAIVRFARDNARPALGLKSGVEQVVRVLTPPTVIGRTDTPGTFLLTPPGALRFVLAVAIVGALGLLAWRGWRRAPAAARLALVALLLVAAGVVNGSKVPQGSESARINLYRWSYGAAFVTFAALGIGLVLVLGRFTRRRSFAGLASRFGVPALLLAAALVAGSTIFVQGTDDHSAARNAFQAEASIANAVLNRIDRHRPVLVVEQGVDATLIIGPYVILRLLEAGVHVQIAPTNVAAFAPSIARQYLIAAYGYDRAYQPRSRPSTVVITSGKAQRASAPGSLVAVEPLAPRRTKRFDGLLAERTALLDQLAAQARDRLVELAPNADALLERVPTQLERFAVHVLFASLPTDPRTALLSDDFLRFVLAGGLRSPALDPNLVRRLIALPPAEFLGLGGGEQVEVRLLRPDRSVRTG